MKSRTATSPGGEVVWVEVCPGDGYRYVAFMSKLPAEVEGGTPWTHVLVTVMGPMWSGGRSAVLSTTGFLAASYVSEKFDLRTGARWFPEVCELLAVALPRREVQKVEEQRL